MMLLNNMRMVGTIYHYENVKGLVDNSHCFTHSMCSALASFRCSLAAVLSTLSSVEKMSGCSYTYTMNVRF